MTKSGPSSAPDRNHDFEGIPVVETHCPELAARDDFSIAFQRNALSLQLELFDQASYVHRRRKSAHLAVDNECNHFKIRDGFCTINANTRVWFNGRTWAFRT